ncbi:MAG: hypothetical protein KAX57_14455, partial [Rhodoferax sp.]|nr:hypothetical protein [Rhodoferax sp.]
MLLQHYFFRGVASFILSGVIGVCAQGASSPDSSAKPSAMDAPLFYQLLLGELNARNDESGAAFSLMLDAARKTRDPAVFRRAVQVAIRARAGESALQAAKAWRDADPTSSEANLFVLQILLGQNRVAETVEPIQREVKLTPAPQQRDFIWRLPGYFDRVGDRRLAATTLQNALSALTDDKFVGATAGAVIGRMWHRAGDN